MHSIRDSSTIFIGSDEDVWSRLKAPASIPTRRRVPLFRRSAASRSRHAADAAAIQQRYRVVQDETGVRPIAWQSLPIAQQERPPSNLFWWLGRANVEPDVDTQTFDLLRTRLLQVLQSNGLTNMAVTAPSPSCGTTFTATNLALSLARLPSCKTVLIDLNFRSPGVAGALGLAPTGNLRRALLGEVPLAKCLVRYGTNLVLGLAGGSEPNPAELLQDPRTMRTLSDMKEAMKPDVIIYDLPPMLAYDDTTALLPQTDGVLLVADGTRTVADQMKRCENALANQTRLLGIVLNRARDGGDSKLRYQ